MVPTRARLSMRLGVRNIISRLTSYVSDPRQIEERLVPTLIAILIQSGRFGLLRVLCSVSGWVFGGGDWRNKAAFATAAYCKLSIKPARLSSALHIFAADRPNEEVEALADAWRPYVSSVEITMVRETNHYNMFTSAELMDKLKRLWHAV